MSYGNNNNKKPIRYNGGLNGDMSALGRTTEYGIETPLSDLVRTGPPVQPQTEALKPKTTVHKAVQEWEIDDLVPVGNGLNGDVSALGFTAQSGIEPMSEKRRMGGGFIDDPSKPKKEKMIGREQQRPMPESMLHARNRASSDYGEGKGRMGRRGYGIFGSPPPTRRRKTTEQVSSEYGNQNW